jgi:hypothetical protein
MVRGKATVFEGGEEDEGSEGGQEETSKSMAKGTVEPGNT